MKERKWIMGKNIFISYSWKTSDENTQKERIKKIVKLLENAGHTVYWDTEKNLPYGANLDAFMEQVADKEKIDIVLVLSDMEYVKKANEFHGGVGQETTLLRPQVYGFPYQTRVIPAFFDKHKELPYFLKRCKAIDFSTTEAIDSNMNSLIEQLRRDSNNRLSSTGAITPCLSDNNEFVEKLIAQLQKFNESYVPSNEKDVICGIEKLLPHRNCIIDKLVHNIDSNKTKHYEFIVNLLERISSEIMVLANSENGSSYDPKIRFKAFEYFEWNLVIIAFAVLLHKKCYHDAYRLLRKKYYIPEVHFQDTDKKEFSISRFYYQVFDACSDDLRTLLFRFDVSRKIDSFVLQNVYPNFLKRENLQFADLTIAQLLSLFNVDAGDGEAESWFPKMYYCTNRSVLDIESQWRKLKDKDTCEEMLPLFGTESIIDLKKMIRKSNATCCECKNDLFGRKIIIPGITRYLEVDDIASR